MKTIKNILSTLTDEEKKQHKDLINECLKRDENIKKHSDKSKENLLKLTDTLTSIIKDVNEINKEVEKINLTIIPTNERIH